MQAVVKTPHIKIKIQGRISNRLLSVLKEEYGPEVRVISEADDEKVNVFETDWYKRIKRRMSPGQNLRVYRQNKGMTQIELGKRLGGLPRQNISNMEKGLRPISKKMALKLAELFDVSVEKFIG
jgi:DNA-binding XRE family transcriptional regulator